LTRRPLYQRHQRKNGRRICESRPPTFRHRQQVHHGYQSGRPERLRQPRKHMVEALHASLKTPRHGLSRPLLGSCVGRTHAGRRSHARTGRSRSRRKILYVGISDAPAWWIARANTLAELRGWTPFIALQIKYNSSNGPSNASSCDGGGARHRRHGVVSSVGRSAEPASTSRLEGGKTARQSAASGKSLGAQPGHREGRG